MTTTASPRSAGPAARLGVGTPQANPTVEAEFRRLLPATVDWVTVRLHSPDASPRTRLVHYLERLPSYLDTLGGMSLQAFCFACTGSSYLAGAAAEQAAVGAVAERYGFPVLTATAALAARLRLLGARRIVLLAPYPDWLLAAARTYWTGRGIEVVDLVAIGTADRDDTHRIYELGSEAALGAVRALGPVRADALVLSGTGMPTLPVLAAARAIAGVPVLSSNLALAAEALAQLGLPAPVLPAAAEAAT